MGYICLAISLLAGSIKGYCGKKTSDYVNEYSDAIFANIFRMTICVLIGFAMSVIQNGISALNVSTTILAIAAFSGITSSIFVVSWLISVKKGAYIMLDVYLMLGLVIPIISGSIIYDECITLRQLFGMLVLFVAVLIMCSYNSSIKGKMTLSSIVLLTVCGTASGLTDLSQKLFIEQGQNTDVSVFNFYTYVFSSLVLVLCYHIFNQKNHKKISIIGFKHIFGYILVMSVCLFINSYFNTMAAAYLSSVQLYPLSKGMALILSLVMSTIFFKERLTLKCIFGMTLAFAALMLINL